MACESLKGSLAHTLLYRSSLSHDTAVFIDLFTCGRIAYRIAPGSQTSVSILILCRIARDTAFSRFLTTLRRQLKLVADLCGELAFDLLVYLPLHLALAGLYFVGNALKGGARTFELSDQHIAFSIPFHRQNDPIPLDRAFCSLFSVVIDTKVMLHEFERDLDPLWPVGEFRQRQAAAVAHGQHDV